MRQSPPVFFLQMASKQVKNDLKELGSYSRCLCLRSVVRNSLKNLFMSRLAFQKKKLLEQQNALLVFFLVFSFSCPSTNLSTDESRL